MCPADRHPRAGNMTAIDGELRCYECFLGRIHRDTERRRDPLAGFASSPFGRIDGFTA